MTTPQITKEGRAVVRYALACRLGVCVAQFFRDKLKHIGHFTSNGDSMCWLGVAGWYRKERECRIPHGTCIPLVDKNHERVSSSRLRGDKSISYLKAESHLTATCT